jgi:hypothetical protein
MKIEIKAETAAEIKKLFSSFDNHMQENFQELFKVLEMKKIVRADIVLYDKYELRKINGENMGYVKTWTIPEEVSVNQLI